MTIAQTVENIMKMSKFYQMNTAEEQETIMCAVGYLENLKIFIERIDGISEEWKERAMGSYNERQVDLVDR